MPDNSVSPLRPSAPPLPATTHEYLQRRKVKAGMNIIDYVEQVHLALIENDLYRKYQEAIFPEQAVERSLVVDDVMAAQMIRKHAEEEDIAAIKIEPLSVIIKAMRRVRNRYGDGRTDRRDEAENPRSRRSGNDTADTV